MAIEKINAEKCVGCGSCVKCCPADVIRMNPEHKAVIQYQSECVLCCWCIKVCKSKAITATPKLKSPIFLEWG